MQSIRSAGFTLIELLIVVSIIGLLAAAFLPDLLAGRETANIAADSKNLSQHYQWLTIYSSPAKVGHLPTEGGHKFLLDVWVRDAMEHTPENFERFFTPGIREEDPHYIELRQRLLNGEKIWTSLRDVGPEDTHYAARAKEYIKGMSSGNEAWAANDNDGSWAFQGGTVNILYGNGAVRPLSLDQMKEQFQWPGKEQIFPTYGKDSPHPDLQKLAN